MSAEVTSIGAPQGSFLATIDFFRMPNGTVRAELRDMAAHVIEQREGISARFDDAAKWMIAAADDFRRQAQLFESEDTQPCK